MNGKAAKLARAVAKTALDDVTAAREAEASRLRQAREEFLAALPAQRYEVAIVGMEEPIYLNMTEQQRADPTHFVKVTCAGGLTVTAPASPPDPPALVHFPPWRIHAIRIVGLDAPERLRPSIILN